MFERYTEAARRLIFFARYEAAQLGSPVIDTEHVLLGLLREGAGLVGPILQRAGMKASAVRKEVEARALAAASIPNSVELPLSAAVIRALRHAEEESERLRSAHIGSEHILLGLLHERGTVAADLLVAGGVQLDGVREELRLPPTQAPGSAGHAFEGLVDFLKELEDRHARYDVLPFRGHAIRVEVALPEERWAVTFFADGRTAAEVFRLSAAAAAETSLPALLDRLDRER